MRKTLILAAVAAMAFASVADAKSCTDPKTHKFVKCPTTAAATTSAPAAATTTTTTGGSPHCTKGKPCGHSCIAVDKVCHK